MMKYSLAWCLVAIALLGCVHSSPSDSDINSVKNVPKYTAEEFYQTETLLGASFSPDGDKFIFSSDQSGIFNIYAMDLKTKQRTQLTDSKKESLIAVSYFPDSERLLYRADQGGNELDHIYVREVSGKVRDLTPGKKVKAYFLGWHKNDEVFWVATNERDARYFDVYEYQTTDYQRQRIFTNKQGYNVGAIREDGRYLALLETVSNADSNIYLWDRQNSAQAPQLITPHKGDVDYSVFSFDPQTGNLVYGTNEQGEFVQAWEYALGSRKRQQLVARDWNVVGYWFSPSGRYRMVALNEDARTRLEIRDRQREAPVVIEDLPVGDLSAPLFAESEKSLAFYLATDRTPRDLFVYDLPAEKLKRLTRALNPKIAPEHLVQGRVIRYESFDDLAIPAILYRPQAASSANPVPAVVWVHGGPGGQSRIGYSPMIQYLVNHGYAILAVNNRGSSGYGKTFYHLDDRKHGDVDLKDCIWGKRYLADLPWVQADNIGIMGGSYGGYMVLAALAFEPEVFDVGIDIFGVSNWVRTLKSIPPYWAAFRESLYSELGDPIEEEERLRSISPLFHADQIRKPLLVTQGANDPRVLQQESDEIVAAVRKNGVPVEYIVFPDEGHGFAKVENRIQALTAWRQFLDRHLRGQQD